MVAALSSGGSDLRSWGFESLHAHIMLIFIVLSRCKSEICTYFVFMHGTYFGTHYKTIAFLYYKGLSEDLPLHHRCF